MNIPKSQTAVELFLNKCNCAQSVFSVFCEEYGLDLETAQKIACGFGSGVRTAEICGAVSGAVMVIGLKYGKSKELCNVKTLEYINTFRTKNKAIVCRDLLQCDIAVPDGREKAVRDNLFQTICVDLVVSSIQILEDLGY